ncbi:MAG: N-acetylmuramoyl-L-alanine amidase [Oscillospiraceae bacterium]|nr:N-acetylmuramoyl-L-alanine amidase [Oscillospiraceae bacterium]
MLRRNLFILLLFIVFICIIGYALFGPQQAEPASAEGPDEAVLFAPYGWIPIIDPGHGGFDPGTESANGALEKDINLDIGLKTDLLLRFLGLNTVMTRSADIAIHESSAVSIRDRKVSDIQNRVRLVGEVENGVLLSIHQNYFDQRESRGAQVFYSGADNKPFAELMQETLRLVLDPDNRRESKATGNVFLLNNVTNPAILIECGFLSNPEEEALLRSETYQRKMAMAMIKGLMDWSAAAQ